MRKIAICLIFLFILNVSYAQDTTKILGRGAAVYFEILGNSATVFSINANYIVKEFKDSYLDVSIGYGRYLGYDINGFNIPFGINYTTDKMKSHHMEFGVGFGLNHQISKKTYNNEVADFEEMRMLSNIRIGYKFQKPGNNFYFRAGFTPIAPLFYFYHKEKGEYTNPKEDNFLKDLDLSFHCIGISVGFSF